jgi:hypothetical protein
MTTATQTQIRRDTATNLTAATPASGELGYDTTNNRIVVGNGTTAGGIKIPSAKDVQNQTFEYATVGGTGNAITLTHSPTRTAYAAGQKSVFKATADSSTAVTINSDGLGTRNVKMMINGVLSALDSTNKIISGGMYEVLDDGTQLQLQCLGKTTSTPGALVYLGTQTAAASATLDFTSLMSSTYDDYLFVIDNLIPATNGVNLYMRTSTDNGANWDASAGNYFYGYNKIAPSGSTTASNSTAGSNSDTKIIIAPTVNNNTGVAINGDVKFRGVNNTAVYKGIKFDLTYFDTAGVAGSNFRSLEGGGVRVSANSINAVRFLMDSGNITSGNIKLYGIAKA